MKKILLTLMICVVGLSAFAQIVIDKGDFPKKDKVYKLFSTDDWFGELSDNLDWGSGTMNETYDFSALDSYLFDTSMFILKSPSSFGFGTQHPNSDFMTITDSQVQLVREPVKLNANDFPSAASKFNIVNVAGSNGFINLNDIVWVDTEDGGPDSWTELRTIGMFPDDTTELELLDATKLPMATSFPNSKVARLADVMNDDVSGKAVLYSYEFYEVVMGEVLMVGTGISYDAGFLSTGTPSGTFKHTSAKAKGRRVWASENWKGGDRRGDTLNWRVQVQEGFTTVIRNQKTISYNEVVSSGIIYLPHDSFEVLGVKNIEFTQTADTFKTPLGNNTDFKVDSSMSMVFWAKGQALPVATIYYNNTNFDSIINMDYYETTNQVPFSTPKEITAFVFYNSFSETNNAYLADGISVIVDKGLLTGIPIGITDTAHATYSKPYAVMSTDYKMGYTHVDTAVWSVNLIDGNFKHTEENTRYTYVDGYGKMYIQGDSVDVIRVKRLESIKSKDDFKTPQGSMSEESTDSNWTMEFIAKNNGLPLVKMDMDSAWQNMWSMQFTDNPAVIVGKAKMNYSNLKAFPNPAIGDLNIQLPVSNSKYVLRVVSLDGRLMSQELVAAGTSQINTASWNKGTYVIQAIGMDSKQVFQTKVVVE